MADLSLTPLVIVVVGVRMRRRGVSSGFDFVFSVLRQEIGWEERFRNHLFCVDWDAKP